MSRRRRWRPWRDCSWDVMRVESVPTATSRISRRRCSTPISSASSASITEGVCMKVLEVVVPSCNPPGQHIAPTWKYRMTNIFDLFNRKISIGRYADFFGLDIYNNKQWIGCVAFEKFIDLKI